MKKYDTYHALLNSKRWRDVRGRRLSADKFLCQQCRARGKLTPAVHVHHIVPVETAHTAADMQRLCYDINNTISLCERCHTEVHTERRKKGTEKAEEKANFAKKFLE